MKLTRTEEINKRLAEIEMELNSPEIEKRTADELDALEKEIRSLKDEKNRIVEAAEKRKALEKEIAEGRSGVDITEKMFGGIMGGSTGMQERTFDASSIEFRNAWAKTLMGQELNEIEKRAYDQVGAAIPTAVADQFFEKMKKLAPMLDEITLLRVAGNVKFYAEGTRNAASKHTENAAVSPATDSAVSVTLGGFEFMKVISISKSAQLMSISAFEAWIVDMLAGDIARAIDDYIINDATNGISAIEFAEDHKVEATAAYTYNNIMDLIAALPAAYDAEAKFLVNKKILWGSIRGIVDSNKRPIFDPESKTICGYPVIEDDYVPVEGKPVYLGRWKDIVGNLSQDVVVDRDEHSGFLRGAIDYRGFAVFDSKPAKKDGIVRLTTTA